ncbi:Protein of unknown function [Bacillus toyonensis]|nr:Protein of unknown function [Bacillus toyonensis]
MPFNIRGTNGANAYFYL